jgi:hypothetical protein
MSFQAWNTQPGIPSKDKKYNPQLNLCNTKE